MSIIKPAPYAERKSQGRYSRKGHFYDKKLEFLKDIEAKLHEGKGKGYVTWAKRFNAKQMAKTILFLQEKEISSYEQLKEITDERNGRLQELKDSMKEMEALLSENKKRQQAIIDYSKNRKVFERYKSSGYSKKFYAEHESELLLYKAAEKVYKEMPKGQKLNMQKLRNEYGRILEEKKKEFLEYARLNKDMHEYLIAKKNLEMLYRQDRQENEKEGRAQRTRNSHSENVL